MDDSKTWTVTIDELFSRLAVDVLEHPGWFRVESSDEDIALSLLAIERGDFLLRAEYVFKLPWHITEILFRPDVLFHASRAEFDDRIEACGIDEHLAPGEANVWSKWRWNAARQRNLSVIGDASVMLDPGEISKVRRLRVARRFDYPLPGRVAMVFAPRTSEGFAFLNSDEAGHATAAFAATLADDPSKTSITEIRRMPRPSIWALSRYTRAFAYPQEYLARFSSSASFQELVESDDSFAILWLRKCASGPPLLPAVACSLSALAELPLDQWVGAGTSVAGRTRDFYLWEFLCSFQLLVEDLGQPAILHDTMDGRRLVPYQAAVRWGDWRRVWPLLEPAFRRQRAAYRHLLGGTCAPQLSVCTEPRFSAIANASWEEPAPSHAQAPGLAESPLRVAVQRTFLHLEAPLSQGSPPRATSTIDIPAKVMSC